MSKKDTPEKEDLEIPEPVQEPLPEGEFDRRVQELISETGYTYDKAFKIIQSQLNPKEVTL